MAGQGALLVGVLCAVLSLTWALPGGWRAADKNSPTIWEMAAFSVSQYNLQSNQNVVAKMITLQDAQEQVVAGMNYKLTLVLGDTACKKSEKYMIKACPLLTDEKLNKTRCDFIVYDIPWENKRSLTKKECARI
uniref:Cystatin domain-containing protein n=1 Tax=Pyxicephalus adspersus TaxID=30357 RepID=A0AAV3A0G7_PYXAD|nr:TPA: hypothetical protein GDO54_002602 [Pyxicephalus adspersus]